jgi:hypothetical protein
MCRQADSCGVRRVIDGRFVAGEAGSCAPTGPLAVEESRMEAHR